jgi:hypothetical protein
VSLVDIDEIDPTVARSLRNSLDHRAQGGDVADMYLTFSIKPNGMDEYMLNRSVAEHFNAFRDGFLEVCQFEAFQHLSPRDIDIILGGDYVYDWKLLRQRMVYGHCRPTDRIIAWFWEVFEEFTEDEKKQFLMFTTGSDCAPVGGLGELELKIDIAGETGQLPKGDRCFNSIVIPPYRSKDELRERLRISIARSTEFQMRLH